jgi:formate hydrogenlyase subunit 4
MRFLSFLLPLTAWAFAPLLVGIINRVKAFAAGRRGAPLFQPYTDLAKLMRKGATWSTTATGVSRMAPAVSLAAFVTATTILPWGSLRPPLSFAGDWVFLAYVLGVARFATVLGALDTGSSFEGMGASREVCFAALAEPAFFLGILVLALFSGQATLADMLGSVSIRKMEFGSVLLLMVACSWFVSLLAENSRIPVDDPNTHLELTMIHEVMVLDYSGPDLGTVLYGAALKLWVFCALLVNLVLPAFEENAVLQVILFLASMGVLALFVGLVESVMARLRLSQVPKLLVGSGALGAIALLLKLLGEKT